MDRQLPKDTPRASYQFKDVDYESGVVHFFERDTLNPAMLKTLFESFTEALGLDATVDVVVSICNSNGTADPCDGTQVFWQIRLND